MLVGCNILNDECLVIFPGTHSKHVVVKNRVLVDFKTYMTGEVFDLLANKSVLSKSVIKNDDQCEAVFAAGVRAVAESNLLNSAFHVRTNALFKKYTAAENYHYLSGLLIGYELKELIDLKKNIWLICGQQLAAKYREAFKILSSQNEVSYINADDALIKGHCKLAAIYYNH
jgi:2-dehydro-3-deoxygalactonokinase